MVIKNDHCYLKNTKKNPITRLCELCGFREAEDETHFVLYRPDGDDFWMGETKRLEIVSGSPAKHKNASRLDLFNMSCYLRRLVFDPNPLDETEQRATIKSRIE